MKKRILIAYVLLYASIANGQPTQIKDSSHSSKPAEKKNDPSWGIKFSGFIRNDVFYDSRQVVSARPANQGELLLYPANVLHDINGKDINAAPSLDMLAITTRLGGKVTGPDAFGAKTSGLIEAEFFGNANGNENVFRLRHAYARLDWPKTQLAFGQYWHPLFVTDCFPAVLSFNTGMPFQPFARNPQIRLTQKFGSDLNLIVAAISQTESFVSNGPGTNIALGTAVANQTYISNSVVPNLHAQLQYKAKSFVAGIALDYKSLRPALSAPSAPGETTLAVSTERVNSLSFETYAKIVTKSIIAKAEFLSGQNMYDHIMIGGYLAYGTAPAITYKPITVNSYWIEIMGTGKKIIPGIFIGYTKNNGASQDNAVTSYTRGITAGKVSIAEVFRVAPRMEMISGKFTFGLELEITSAAYGTAGSNAKVTSTTNTVTDNRILFISSYSF
ncbi:MAG: DcaP family trimeric outer membrane transporter [Sediminibacterium sp.]